MVTNPQNLFQKYKSFSTLDWNACWLCKQSNRRLSLWGKTASVPSSMPVSSSPDHLGPDGGSGSGHCHSHRRRMSSPQASWRQESRHTRRVSWIHPAKSHSWCSNSRKSWQLHLSCFDFRGVQLVQIISVPSSWKSVFSRRFSITPDVRAVRSNGMHFFLSVTHNETVWKQPRHMSYLHCALQGFTPPGQGDTAWQRCVLWQVCPANGSQLDKAVTDLSWSKTTTSTLHYYN